MYFLNILRRFCDFCEHPSLLFLISLRIQEDFDTWYQKHCFPLPWIIRKYLFVLYSWWNFVLCFQSHGCLAFEFAAKFKLKRGLIWNFDTAHTLEGGGKDRIEKVGVEVLGWGNSFVGQLESRKKTKWSWSSTSSPSPCRIAAEEEELHHRRGGGGGQC